MTYPYSDQYMRYDINSHQYVLTKKYVLEQLGIDLDKQAKGNKVFSDWILKRVSTLIYGYIHKHNINTRMQDYIIAKTKSARDIIFNAMSNQFIYMKMVGDLSMTTDRAKRDLVIDATAEEELSKFIPEIGSSILYNGYLNYYSEDKTEW